MLEPRLSRPVLPPPILPARYLPWPSADRALLGRGGASEVWRCQDRELGVLVALKVLRSEGARLAGRLEREAAVSASVVHPNVIALHDMGRTPDGKPCLAFALASDGSLLDHAARPPRWPLLKELTIGLLDALGALHARGLLHLDVKLSNLLVHRSSAHARVLWLADLGVARARYSEEEDEGMVLGTVGYMAPERLTGQHQLWGPPTDLFSVGAVLFRMLTSELPFPDKDPVEALAARQRPPAQVPVREGLEVPAGLEDIVLALLHPDRRARFDLAADVVRAIAALPDPGPGPILGQSPADPPRLALMAELGEDSLINWPPDETAPRPLRPRLEHNRAGLPWRQPAPIRPLRKRPRPYFPRRVPQSPQLIVHREIPVIGRDAELDQLWAAARAVLRHRQPLMVTILGTRGMGRTRLVDELTRTMERAGMAQGVKLEYSGRTGPTQGLEGAMRRLLPPLPDARAYRNDVARTLSRLRDLPAAACRHDAAALADWVSPRDGSPARDRSAARSFLVEHLAATAWRGLSWLWLEDVHLAGETDDAWTIIDMIFARPSPTLVLCTAEDHPSMRQALRPLRRLEARFSRRSQRIQLAALGLPDARRLARAHLPMESPLVEELVTCTGGHPQYLHDIIVHQVRRGDLVPGPVDPQGNPSWRRAEEAPALPRSRDDFAQQRLDWLAQQPEDLHHALLAVRLAGTGAPEHVVGRVIGTRLDRLISLGFVRVDQEGLHIDSPELKRAVSQLLRSPELDATLHENLAAAWREEGEDPLAEARTGLHLALAGHADEALPVLSQAVRRLQGMLRPQPLSRIAARAMELADLAGEGGRSAWIEAALVRADALWELGLAEDALAVDRAIARRELDPGQAVRAACLHAQHLGLTGAGEAGLARLQAVTALLPDLSPIERAELLTSRALLRAAGRDHAGALLDIDAALQVDLPPATRARALLQRAESLVPSDPTAALAAAREVQDLARMNGLLQAEIQSWEVVGRLAVREGLQEQTVHELEAGIVRLRRVGERAAAGHLLSTLGTIRRDAGEPVAARQAWTDALALEATGRERFARAARLGLATLAAEDGDAPRLRVLAEAAGAPVDPEEARLWACLRSIGAVLEAEEDTLVELDPIIETAKASPEGRRVALTLLRWMTERGHAARAELQARLRRVTRDAPQGTGA